MPQEEGLQTLEEIGRQVYRAGPVLVKVKGGAHFSGYPLGYPSELGLSTQPIRFTPQFYREDIHADPLGRQVPADVMVMGGTAVIKMTLIHYNPNLLELLIGESFGGDTIFSLHPDRRGFVGTAGAMAPPGTLMGGRKPIYASGNKFFSVTLFPGNPRLSGAPYRFRCCHLTDRPIHYPLGAGASQVEVEFRAIPYTAQTEVVNGQTVKRREVAASGAFIWDRLIDTSGV